MEPGYARKLFNYDIFSLFFCFYVKHCTIQSKTRRYFAESPNAALNAGSERTIIS